MHYEKQTNKRRHHHFKRNKNYFYDNHYYELDCDILLYHKSTDMKIYHLLINKQWMEFAEMHTLINKLKQYGDKNPFIGINVGISNDEQLNIKVVLEIEFYVPKEPF